MSEYSELQEHCTQWKSDGDNAYRESRYQDAIIHYSDIIDGLELKAGGSSASMVASLPQSLLDILYIAHSNRCASYLQKHDFIPALVDAQRCVEYQPYWAKGYTRLGMCYHKLHRLSEAIAAYEQVLAFDETNSDAKIAIEKIKLQLNKEREAKRQHGPGLGSGLSSGQRSTYASSTSSSTSNTPRPATNISSSERQQTTATVIDYVKVQFQQWIEKAKSYNYRGIFRSIYYRATSSWLSLAPETRQYIIYGIVGLLLYYFFYYRSSPSAYSSPSSSSSAYFGRRYDDPDEDDDYHYRYRSSSHRSGYGGYGSGEGQSTGLSWSAWAAVMAAAYKLPPMFPDQLGQYARPFFGMNWTTFMWLLNMFTNNRNMGRFGRGMFGGNRRRF